MYTLLHDVRSTLPLTQAASPFLAAWHLARRLVCGDLQVRQVIYLLFLRQRGVLVARQAGLSLCQRCLQRQQILVQLGNQSLLQLTLLCRGGPRKGGPHTRNLLLVTLLLCLDLPDLGLQLDNSLTGALRPRRLLPLWDRPVLLLVCHQLAFFKGQAAGAVAVLAGARHDPEAIVLPDLPDTLALGARLHLYLLCRLSRPVH
mmetsp:Transcript_7010/g.17834  ORF Transcript_7010/g.17834 Transcript_7010/m.17834 type:complete len:202 (+) Transcript_7010:102-707(+)